MIDFDIVPYRPEISSSDMLTKRVEVAFVEADAARGRVKSRWAHRLAS